MDTPRVKKISLKLLKPYEIPRDCPYLSEDQKILSLLPLKISHGPFVSEKELDKARGWTLK